jgi:hypothetical protein
MTYIIGTPEFIKKLDNWIAHNDKSDANWIKSKKNLIPLMFRTYNQYLYRGMVIDEIGKSGLTFDQVSSWTRSEKLAIAFATDPKFKTSKSKGALSILIKKKIPASKIIFDIYGFFLFMGEAQLEMLGVDDTSIDSIKKEQEVLVDKGIKILTSDIKYL